MIAISTPGGVVFRDFEADAKTADTIRVLDDVNAEAQSHLQAIAPRRRCPTARQLLPDPQPAPADTKETGHG